jgi:hypothetical protein
MDVNVGRYGRLQAASGRSHSIEWPLDRIGGQGTWPARFRAAAQGGTAWGWAGADGGCAEHEGGVAPSKPSSSLILANSGMIASTGVFGSSLPRSIRIIAAVEPAPRAEG